MIKNCGRCERAVYPTEELKCLDKVWHKTCFKCQTCGMTLNMKTYKGFNKLPYCEAHIPKVKATTVSETPESRRLAENTKLQSQVKYHEDFEKAKGKFTQVADDPETLRIKANTKIISNVAYHGELEKKALMEQKRNLTGADDTVKSESPEPLSISPLPPSMQQTTQQQQKVHIDPNANQYTPGKIINNQQKFSVGNIPPDQNESPYSARQYSSSTTVYSSQPTNEDLVEYLWEDVGTGKSRAQPNAFYHGVAAPPSRAVGSIADYDPLNENYGSIARSYRGPSQNQQPQNQYVANQQVPSHQHQIRNQGYSQPQSVQQPQQQQYSTTNNVSGYRQQNYIQQSANQYQQSPTQYQPPSQVSQQYSGQRQSQVKSNQPTGYQSQGQYQPPAYQANPAPQYQANPAAQYQQSQPQYQNNYRQDTYSQQQQYQPYNQASMQRKPQGQAFRAMYDYDAQDTDEVSFLDGDIIINCTPIDEGWMTGTVKRTGQNGMIPANYVEQIH